MGCPAIVKSGLFQLFTVSFFITATPNNTPSTTMTTCAFLDGLFLFAAALKQDVRFFGFFGFYFFYKTFVYIVLVYCRN